MISWLSFRPWYTLNCHLNKSALLHLPVKYSEASPLRHPVSCVDCAIWIARCGGELGSGCSDGSWSSSSTCSSWYSSSSASYPGWSEEGSFDWLSVVVIVLSNWGVCWQGLVKDGETVAAANRERVGSVNNEVCLMSTQRVCLWRSFPLRYSWIWL